MIKRFYTAGHKIQRVTHSQDSRGGPIEIYADHLTLDGKLWQLKANEQLTADKETSIGDYKFACELADIVETDRYLDPDGEEYTIKGIAKRTRPDGSGHIELMLEKVK